ncbi:hypothetical protein JZ751_022452 [Albula glossodonta]|uniref:Uncharacterized protein n=1 Tax=Albula glossodonta TaxID=121402 RepID=A0A8T2NJB6_9TELE|nr:hypothetical protein JZ751_022452 [Albula glossodonta]
MGDLNTHKRSVWWEVAGGLVGVRGHAVLCCELDSEPYVRVAEKEPINKMSLHNLATVQVLLYYLQHPPISFTELKRNTLYFSTDV